MKRFKTAYSITLILVVAIPLFAVLIINLLIPSWFGFAFILATVVLFSYTSMQTYYDIDEKNQLLIVRCGKLASKTIKIVSIHKVVDSNSPVKAPAMSFKRLEIRFNKYDSILLSPKDKLGFVKALQVINPDIVYQPQKANSLQKKAQ